MKLSCSIFLLTFLNCAGISSLGAPVLFAQQTTASDQEAEETQLRKLIKQSPNNPSYPARLGSLLASENKMEEAIVYFQKALKLSPSDLATRRNLAVGEWQLGKLPEARKNLEIVLKASPDDAWSTLLLGMVSEDLGDHNAAAKLLSDELPLVRERPETITSLARAYYHLGEAAKAQETLQLLAVSPAGPEATFQGGRVAAQFGDYDTAEKLFLSVRSSYPEPAALNYNLALAQYSARRYSDSQNTLQDSIADGHGTSEDYALLARAYLKQDRLPEMLDAFEKAINLEPANETNYLDLGQALLDKRNYKTAMEVANETMKRFPASSRAYSLKGGIELGMDVLTDAGKSFTQAIELDPNDPQALLGLALTQWNASRDAEAEKSFEAGVRKFPDNAFLQLKYALFLLNSPEENEPGRQARIVQLLKKSEQLDDSIAETHFQLGNLAMKENKYDVALKQLEIAAREDPDLSKVHYAVARVYRRLGREDDAARETEIFNRLKAKENQHAEPNAPMATRHE